MIKITHEDGYELEVDDDEIDYALYIFLEQYGNDLGWNYYDEYGNNCEYVTVSVNSGDGERWKIIRIFEPSYSYEEA